MHVIATAGHVDHGKSTLVRALTGMEPDRWEEERRRGLTLDLGFVWTSLPGAGRIAFVDVPGHERLVGNMLAGVGPVPAVLIAVAADQGWQPQSEEHLAVLNALRVRHGVLAVTRADLADPGPVRDDALARIAETSLGKIEAVPVSAVTGAGVEELRAALVRLTAALPEPDRAADVRLWADRSFTVRGRGTVVTGTLAAGTLRTGDRLLLARDDRAVVRVRGLQSLKEEREEVGAVARVAVNVHGAGAEALRRGDALLAPGRWITTGLLDVRLHGDPADDLPRHLVLHAGSAAVPATVRPLGADTARLTLARPLPLRVGDVALLRDPGRHRIPAGITVLDVRPPRLERRGAGRARARELETAAGVPDGADQVRCRGLVRRAELRAMGVRPPYEPVAGDWIADPGHWAGLRRALARAVEEHAARHPMDPGLPAEAARRALGLPERALVRALVAAGPRPPLEHRDGRVYGSTARPRLPPRVREAVDAVRAELRAAPFRAPEAHRLAELGLTPNAVAAAVAAGELLRIGDGIVLLPGADDRAAALLARLEQPFTTSEARRALDTTRRVVIPLLEHLDASGLTARLDNTRRRCESPAGQTAGAPDG
ncbi:selenocysteine-specific translation elongation factor [Streptomyces sp. CNQ085]|uniref:selenocysteine-specific translation elongation factor n=1 Tax=Streptomyces sp. CNQ085 TaxID=2886944 RepID=UPI001F50F38B|nr:selenocysteine-specific translation elongation factor [Streptomyces sp. CNQ085]MCI0385458.1 SelB C-terminal domain-containing protein [Streptomyces sp. CNQ085]